MNDAMNPADTPLTEALKTAIRSFYRSVCQYCGDEGTHHVEHIIAQAKGGPDTLGNATLACWRCNLRKGTIDLDPMFLAIAHARAAKNAERIYRAAALSTRRREKPMAPRPATAPAISKARQSASAIMVLRPPASVWNVLALDDVLRAIPDVELDRPHLAIPSESCPAYMLQHWSPVARALRLPFGPTAKQIILWIKEEISLSGNGEFGLDFDDQATAIGVADQAGRLGGLILPGAGCRYDVQGCLVDHVVRQENRVEIGISPHLLQAVTRVHTDSTDGHKAELPGTRLEGDIHRTRVDPGDADLRVAVDLGDATRGCPVDSGDTF